MLGTEWRGRRFLTPGRVALSCLHWAGQPSGQVVLYQLQIEIRHNVKYEHCKIYLNNITLDMRAVSRQMKSLLSLEDMTSLQRAGLWGGSSATTRQDTASLWLISVLLAMITPVGSMRMMRESLWVLYWKTTVVNVHYNAGAPGYWWSTMVRKLLHPSWLHWDPGDQHLEDICSPPIC